METKFVPMAAKLVLTLISLALIISGLDLVMPGLHLWNIRFLSGTFMFLTGVLCLTRTWPEQKKVHAEKEY